MATMWKQHKNSSMATACVIIEVDKIYISRQHSTQQQGNVAMFWEHTATCSCLFQELWL